MGWISLAAVFLGYSLGWFAGRMRRSTEMARPGPVELGYIRRTSYNDETPKKQWCKGVEFKVDLGTLVSVRAVQRGADSWATLGITRGDGGPDMVYTNRSVGISRGDVQHLVERLFYKLMEDGITPPPGTKAPLVTYIVMALRETRKMGT